MGDVRTSIPGGRPDGTAQPAACGNCRLWKRDDPQPGRMPGVSPENRLCDRPRIDKSTKEYRAPTDWCDQWRGRDG